MDIYVFGAKAEGDTYTFREHFAYRQDGSTIPSGAKELNLTQGADNATTTALLELQKGLFVRLYCIANQTELGNPVGGTPVADTYFDPLTYDIATGTEDADYQLHKATMNIKHNNTTVKSYTIWRSASYIGYPMESGASSPYYTAIKKGSYYWAPVNLGATRVAIANDGKSGKVEGTGNLYQWGRADATNHGGSTQSGPQSNKKPNNNIFYKNSSSPSDWLSPQDNTLWNGSNKGPLPFGIPRPNRE